MRLTKMRELQATPDIDSHLRMRREQATSDPATAWAIRASVAVIFFLTGLDKFLPGPSVYWIHVFDLIGLGRWFRYFTGIIEMVGGLLFLMPIATPIGAAILAITMVGAMLTQAVVLKHPLDSIFPGLYLAGVVLAFVKLRPSRSSA